MDRQLRGDVLKKLACPRDEMNPALLGDKFLVVETGFRRVHTCCDQSGSKSKTKSSRHRSRWQKFTSDFSSVDSLQWTQTACNAPGHAVKIHRNYRRHRPQNLRLTRNSLPRLPMNSLRQFAIAKHWSAHDHGGALGHVPPSSACSVRICSNNS